MTLFVYRQVHDSNLAPCVFRGKLSLSCCKPVIRRVAKNDDWFMGIAAKGNCFGAQAGQLVYLAQVSNAVPLAEYAAARWNKRPDSLHHQSGGVWKTRGSAPASHRSQSARQHDLSGRNALVATTFKIYRADWPNPEDWGLGEYPASGRGHNRYERHEGLGRALAVLPESILRSSNARAVCRSC